MDKEHMLRLVTACEMTRELRRLYNNMLHDAVRDKHDEHNLEDLMRLVGTLEALYNHLLASLASDGDLFCCLKHLSYAIVLAGELDVPNVEKLYEILSIVTNGKLEACDSCKREEDISEAEEPANVIE